MERLLSIKLVRLIFSSSFQPISDQLSASDKAVKGSRKSISSTLVPGSKRSAPVTLNSPAAAAAAADVQGAVVEKGIEVMGKMVDKQLQIIDEAQEKAENFLKKEVNFG